MVQTSEMSAPPKQPDQEAATPAPAEGPEYINIPAAAELMGISAATLRNYVWLQGIPKRQRTQRALQDPPAKMPRPKRIRGHHNRVWLAIEFNSWLKIWKNRKS